MPDLSKFLGPGECQRNGVSDLLEAAYAENTRRAYRSDIASFLEWGGVVPSSPEQIAEFIAYRANFCTVATIKRQLASLSVLHTTLEHEPNPLKSPLVAAAERGLSRLHGAPQRAVEPLLIEHLRLILDVMPSTTVGKRDAALLLVGFACGMRRSELVGLNIEDLVFVPAGVRISINRSKTDQLGQGRSVAIQYGRTRYCPIRHLEVWLETLGVFEGALFRSCAKGGRVNGRRLSSEAVAKIVKNAVATVGLNPKDFSGHSLRAGFVTSAVQAGAAEHAIRRQTGHSSSATMERYVRPANLFEDNPTRVLF